MEVTFRSGNFNVHLHWEDGTPLTVIYDGPFCRATDDEENDPTLANRDFLDYLEAKHQPQLLQVDISRVTFADEWGRQRLRETVAYLRDLGFVVRKKRISTLPHGGRAQYAGPEPKPGALPTVARLVKEGTLVLKRLEPLVFRFGLLVLLTVDIGRLTGIMPKLHSKPTDLVQTARNTQPGGPCDNIHAQSSEAALHQLAAGTTGRCALAAVFVHKRHVHMMVEIAPTITAEERRASP